MQAARLTSPGRFTPQDHAAAEICAVLRGEPTRWQDARAFAELAVSEGLAPLVCQSRPPQTLSPAASALLREDVRRQLALAVVREPELRRVLAALACAGVEALVIKGAHVAHMYYPDAALRPRNDTDLLVRPGKEGAAHRALEALGYRRQPAITGEAVQGQVIFEHETLPGSVLDVHSRLASPILAAELFDFEALWRRATAVPALGPTARGPHLFDALAIAAVHLLAHHPNELGLLWLHDLHVLVTALPDDELAAFAGEAASRRMTTLLAAALRKADARFPSPRIQALLGTLACDASEPSAALVVARPPSRQALSDVRVLATWKDRRAYVAAHLFPPSDYMRRRYAPGSTAPLAWLYAARIMRGSVRWFMPGLKTRPTRD